MAKLEPPAKKTPARKASVEAAVAKAAPKKPIEQTPPDAIAPLQLKIPQSKKNEFKAYAAMRGQAMNELFVEMFDDYKEQHN